MKKKYLWDFDYEELKKTKQGRIFILERMINYGPEEGEKIRLSDVKRYWDKLHLYPDRRRLFEFLIWRKNSSLPKSKNSFSIL